MRALFFTLAFGSLALLFLPGCSEDHITNNTYPRVPGETGLVGRVIPAEPDIVLALWQATMIRQTTADDSGYYKIVNLQSGMYELRVTPPGGSTRIYHNVSVKTGNLREYNINLEDPPLPPLFYSVHPPDGSTGVDPMGDYILLSSRTVLDASSFDSAIVITPPLSGAWGSYYDPYVYEGSDERSPSVEAASDSGPYVFRPDSQFTPFTQYTVRILPTLRLADGSTWGDSLRFAFTVDSLRVVCLRLGEHKCGDATIPLRNFDVFIRFNAYVNIDSLNTAASFSPSIDGIWYKYEHYYYGSMPNEVLFFYIEPLVLRAERPYILTIDGGVAISGPVGFGNDFELNLVTEPVAVARILPPMGAEAEVDTWVEVEFNTLMDHASAEAALTVSEFDGPVVTGKKVWIDEYKLTFRPDAPLIPGRAYQVEVENTAVSLAGDTMRDEAYSFFRAAY